MHNIWDFICPKEFSIKLPTYYDDSKQAEYIVVHQWVVLSSVIYIKDTRAETCCCCGTLLVRLLLPRAGHRSVCALEDAQEDSIHSYVAMSLRKLLTKTRQCIRTRHASSSSTIRWWRRMSRMRESQS